MYALQNAAQNEALLEHGQRRVKLVVGEQRFHLQQQRLLQLPGTLSLNFTLAGNPVGAAAAYNPTRTYSTSSTSPRTSTTTSTSTSTSTTTTHHHQQLRHRFHGQTLLLHHSATFNQLPHNCCRPQTTTPTTRLTLDHLKAIRRILLLFTQSRFNCRRHHPPPQPLNSSRDKPPSPLAPPRRPPWPRSSHRPWPPP